MSVTRSELRRLRNQVYARLLSRQNVKNHLMKYKSLAEIFMEEKKTKLSMNEIAALKIRVMKTEKAAVQLCASDGLTQRLESLRGQSVSSSILSAMNKSSFFMEKCSDMTSSLPCTLPISCKVEKSFMATSSGKKFSPLLANNSKTKISSFKPPNVSNLVSTCKIEENSMATARKDSKFAHMLSSKAARVQPCDKPDAENDIDEISQGDELLSRLRRLRGQPITGPSILCSAKQRMFLTGQSKDLTSWVSTCKTEERPLDFSETVPDSAALSSGYSKVEFSEMDHISEAMATIMTSATLEQNHGMIRSFIEETEEMMGMSSSVLTNSFSVIDKAESVQDCSKETRTVSVNLPKSCSFITPWKKRGFIFTRLF